ncbi:replication-relaxation family protein [Oceanobacillus sp. FSL K6-2867]|uniref:replication-relaxation family protein n=1 Tax=Oceanobacillus sp. FSL K6-2867 TaxID=2954748 RepID=UPI0030DCE3A8
MERTEELLMTIDKLKMTTIRQLRQIHQLGGYRNSARIIEQLEPYLNVCRGREKVIYLNKAGRELIGSTKEIKKTPIMEHTLLGNDAYIYLGKPLNWQTEYVIECEKKQKELSGIVFNFNNKPAAITKRKIIADAVFIKQGYAHIVEIDNTRTMQDNLKKINQYKELWQQVKGHFELTPMLYFFTTTDVRKKKLSEALKSVNHKVYTFDEIK